jgi:hypothetical protein
MLMQPGPTERDHPTKAHLAHNRDIAVQTA